MTVDVSKILPGDKVALVPLEVRWVTPAGLKIAVLDAEGMHSYFGPDQIAAHHPAPREIGVGDRVYIKGQPTWSGLVRGLDGEDAWIKWDHSRPMKSEWPLTDLTLVEGDHERA
jgi:hypothetical protein